MATIQSPSDSLSALKRYLLPSGDQVSQSVVENDPELALPQATSNADFAGNERLKQALGLGPSPMLQQQRKDLTAQDEGINAARIAANPEVAAQTTIAQKQKLALAGEPNRVAGENQLAVEKQKQEPLRQFMSDQQNQGAGHPPIQFVPSVSENGVTFRGEAPEKLNQQEQAVVDTAHGINSLAGPLLGKFEAKFPGIAADPKKYGSLLADTLAPKIGKAAYMFGGMTDNDELMQDTGAIQAWAARAFASGRMSKPLLDLVMMHLPQAGFSYGANYDRLKRLVTDILPSQLEGISQGRGANPMALSPVPESNPYRDPNYQPK